MNVTRRATTAFVVTTTTTTFSSPVFFPTNLTSRAISTSTTSISSRHCCTRSLPSSFLTSSFLSPNFSSVTHSSSFSSSTTMKATFTNDMSTPPVDVLQYPRDGAVTVTQGPSTLSAYQGDLLVLAVWAEDDTTIDNNTQEDTENEKDKTYQLPEIIKEFDTCGVLADAILDADFKAKLGSSTEVCRMTSGKAKRVVLFGLGSKSSSTCTHAPAAAARFAVTKGTRREPTSVGLYIDGINTSDMKFVSEGAVVGGYIDERYKHEKKRGEGLAKIPKEIQLIATSKFDQQMIDHGTAIGAGVITTKELVNSPANELTPAALALASEKVAKESGLDCKILGLKECQELGMGLYLGVGRGSTDEPKFIHLTYKPQQTGPPKKKVCIVGKAVTFDTGGTNLKAGAGSMIELMKFDMGGAGATLGAAKAIGKIKPDNIEVHFIMPAVENMIGDRAIHPGDILTASNGKTVEVINTDAEGRLCLADALIYSEKLGDVDYVVDLATLTGAIIVSLGNDVAGMWSSSDDFANDLSTASQHVGEKFWRMPLVDEYVEGLKSKIADLRNIGTGRAAGSITAALFLREFVTTKNWAHLDIAGTVWADKSNGATGFGVKTLVQWVETLSKNDTKS